MGPPTFPECQKVGGSFRSFDTLYQQHIVRPGNLGNELLPSWESGQLGTRRLPNCGGWCEGVRVFVGELHHEFDVSLGETLHFRQFVPKFAGQAGDDSGSPALLSLSLVDQAADVPVEPDQFGVRGEYRPRLCLLDPGLDFLKEIREAGRNGQLSLAHATLQRTVKSPEHSTLETHNNRHRR